MNRLRHAYLRIEPGLEPYLTTGHHQQAARVMRGACDALTTPPPLEGVAKLGCPGLAT
jgi:hypothetical protein